LHWIGDVKGDASNSTRARRRLILHAGTPRTGTTALQFSLQRHDDELRERGVLYPPVDWRPPKHQWLVGGLRNSGKAATVSERTAQIFSGLSDDIHTVILSAEGLFLHWWDFTDEGRLALRSLEDLADVELWVWFREPIAFAGSLYVKMLMNPQTPVAFYGRDVSFEEALDVPWFKRQLDYASYIRDVDRVLGEGTVRPHAYAGDTVNDFFKLLGMEVNEDERAPHHRTLGHLGVDLVRRINQVPLEPPLKEQAVELILQLEETVDPGPFRISDEAALRVEEINGPSRDLLARDYGVVLSSGIRKL
jgi:hypothetical protein